MAGYGRVVGDEGSTQNHAHDVGRGESVPSGPAQDRGPAPDRRVVWVHRIGAVLVAVAIAVFGVLGLIGGLGFFDTAGAPVLGLSTNGLLSTISLVTAAVLLSAAIRAGRTASTVMMVIGTAFLISAFANLAVLGTPYNVLAFRLPNVFFSIGAGLVLLFVGAYGRASARLPRDNPYWQEAHDPAVEDSVARDAGDLQPRPRSAEEAAADAAMATAERAAASGTATEDQRRGVAAMDQWRMHEDRRAAWISALSAGRRGSG